MIGRMISYTFLFFLMIAIPLSVAGFTHVEMSEDFIAFLKTTSSELNNFKIAIPNVPLIPKMNEDNNFFVLVLNLLISFINSFATIVNVLTTILNVVIQVIQFIVLLIKNAVNLIHNVQFNNGGESIDTSEIIPPLFPSSLLLR